MTTLPEQREAEIEALRAEIKADEPIYSPEDNPMRVPGDRYWLGFTIAGGK